MCNRRHNERCKACKARVKQMLSCLFDRVEVNWDLDLPGQLDGYKNYEAYKVLEQIHRALQENRGFKDFAKSRKLPRVDFFIPDGNLIIEFDESQHFTAPRDISLSLYPEHKGYGFSVESWRALCQKMNKRDNDPPYRDEQRAWYDTLRDFAPIHAGVGKTIRLYSRDAVWCSMDISCFQQIIMNQTEN